MKPPKILALTGVIPCVAMLILMPKARSQVEAFEPPPIHSQGDSKFGKPPTRPQKLSDIVTEIAQIGKRGTWRLDKRWEIIINSLESAEVPTLLDAVAKLAPSAAREDLYTALYSRWAETDPSAAMKRIAQESDPVTRGACLQAVFQGWAHANAAEVIAWAEQLQPGNVKLMAYMAATPYETANQTKPMAAASDSHAPRATPPDSRAALVEAAKILDRGRRLTTYKSIAKEWAAADPAAATQWAVELSIAEERDTLVELTTDTWSRVNAEQALTFMTARREVPRYLVERAAKLWAARDVPSVVRWTRNLSDTRQRLAVLSAIMPFLVDQAPDDAIDFIATIPAEDYEFGIIAGNAALHWAETDPDRMFKLWRKLPPDAVTRLLGQELLKLVLRTKPLPLLEFLRELPPGRRAEPYASAVAVLSAKDPMTARNQLAALIGASDEIAIRRLLVQRLLDTNFDFALELYTELPAGQPQSEALQMIADRWSRKDPAKALAWIRSLPASPLTQNALQNVIHQLGQANPQAALAELESLPTSSMRRGLTADLVATWATKDFAAAHTYSQKLPEGEMREAVLLATAQRIGYGEPVKGLELLLLGELTSERMNAVQQIAMTWVQNDSLAAQRWAEHQSNAAVREAILLASLHPLCQSAPATAATMIERLTLPQNVRQAVGIVAQSWTTFDPFAASRWAAEHAAGPVRDQAIAAVLGHLSQQDYRAATRWVSALPPDIVPDEAWGQLAQNTFGRQPAEAMRWAAQIKNAKNRDNTIVQFGGYWLRQNPTAAEAWLGESGLSAELIERIRKATQPGR